ncbi:unnamed protein product (macronuclear) [Paramecium tetraurelia]|uniref:Uncharacterized protein n=1 Tax=Paramecium tetraurelia TaxID=5888 RepID=A0CMY3_PARTE|nr:uncharacterized protein GSPATT00008591001 [Paramecium tetraurelia]CAK72150.1 unnamed protein product [Paramecium tetraurelia]|eukprot:XP_001439547.1 hypothetical protein (macronuclear) [Paramecium tetraurelia strain d4-2]
MKRENKCDSKSRSRSRSKSSKRNTQNNQFQNFIDKKLETKGTDQQIDNKESISHHSSPIRSQEELQESNELNKKNKEEYKIVDQIQCINLAATNQSQIQLEQQDQDEKCFISMSQPQQETGINSKETFNKQPSEMITINDSSLEVNQNAQKNENRGGSQLENRLFGNFKKTQSRNSILRRKQKKFQSPPIKQSSQHVKQPKQSLECIDLTNDDNILSFFGLNHPMLLSSLEYDKKELFELAEPYEYQCGNFMLSLGIQNHYTAIVTLPNLSQKKPVYYLFMMFQFDPKKNIYCMVPEDDQTTLLVSSNISSLYYYCNSNIQQKKNNKTTQIESNLKYKFPYIYPSLIRKYVVSYQQDDSQILYQINYNSNATQQAIEDYYWDDPGHLITGTSHPFLKILFFKSKNNQIPSFYFKFISTPLYEGQYSLKASLKQNGNQIVVDRRFLSPFSYGVHPIKIEINRITNQIVMKQTGTEDIITSKNVKCFWDQVLPKYLQLYNPKQLYYYFVDLINQDRRISEKYKKWNQLYQYMSKSNQQKSSKPNDETVILNDKQFFSYSIEEKKNGNKINYQ